MSTVRHVVVDDDNVPTTIFRRRSRLAGPQLEPWGPEVASVVHNSFVSVDNNDDDNDDNDDDTQGNSDDDDDDNDDDDDATTSL